MCKDTITNLYLNIDQLTKFNVIIVDNVALKDYKYFAEGDELNKYWTKNYFKIVDDV